MKTALVYAAGLTDAFLPAESEHSGRAVEKPAANESRSAVKEIKALPRIGEKREKDALFSGKKAEYFSI